MLPLLCLLSAVGRNQKDCGYSDGGWHQPVLTQREATNIQCEERVETETVKYGDIVPQMTNRQVRIKTPSYKLPR